MNYMFYILVVKYYLHVFNVVSYILNKWMFSNKLQNLQWALFYTQQ